MKKLAKISLISASLAMVGMAYAVDLGVSASIPAYCEISLANGSSSTASIAMENVQTIANLDMSCNTPGGAELTVEALNGDFVNTANSNILVNYALILDADIDAFDVDETDASPAAKTFVRTLGSYSPDLADGISAVFSLNMNVDAPGPFPTGQILFPATNAPAGDYTESFSFTIASL